MNVFFLGPEGSFSAILARQCFSEPAATIVSCNDFDQILQAVCTRPNAIGILPLENSITSNVHENVESLFSARLHIVGEAYLHVRLHAIGLEQTSVDSLTDIYSHPKALQQCSQWIEAHALHPISCRSTSEARQLFLERRDSTSAFIGAAVLADSSQGLGILAADVGNVKQNSTRFVFISKARFSLSSAAPDKLSLTFTARHQPGSLALVLNGLADLGVNLTKIVSQPIPGSDFEYNFWIDVECDPEQVSATLDKMRETTREYSVIGLYSRGKKYQS